MLLLLNFSPGVYREDEVRQSEERETLKAGSEFRAVLRGSAESGRGRVRVAQAHSVPATNSC